jgi:hypothetical protein
MTDLKTPEEVFRELDGLGLDSKFYFRSQAHNSYKNEVSASMRQSNQAGVEFLIDGEEIDRFTIKGKEVDLVDKMLNFERRNNDGMVLRYDVEQVVPYGMDIKYYVDIAYKFLDWAGMVFDGDNSDDEKDQIAWQIADYRIITIQIVKESQKRIKSYIKNQESEESRHSGLVGSDGKPISSRELSGLVNSRGEDLESTRRVILSREMPDS